VDEAVGAVSPIPGIQAMHTDELPRPRTGQWMFVAVGQAEVRCRLMHRLGSEGWNFPIIKHRSSWIAPDATVAAGVLVAAGAIVETKANVGQGAIIDIGALVDHDCVVGAYCHVRPGQVMEPREAILMPRSSAG